MIKANANIKQEPVQQNDCERNCCHYPPLMTEAELIEFLRIPEISGSQNHHNVVEHLKKARGLPRIHICHKVLYPQKAVLEWVEKETDAGK